MSSTTTHDQNTMTDSVVIMMIEEKKSDIQRKTRLCCGISLNSLTKIAIHLILPLTLGIFTVAITFYQQEVSKQQQQEDRELARIQREQDLNISAAQREQDKIIAREQREEDELRRFQDLNISAVRRDLDLHIAELKRKADDLNAEKQRNISQEQRQYEFHMGQQQQQKQMTVEFEQYEQERTKYHAQLSLSYMNEISSLLEKYNGSLNSNPISAALGRAKTLNVIGQLGSNRSRPLIEFLHDAKQLTTKKNPLDLSGAQLNGIDFRGATGLYTRQNLALIGVHLNDAIFENMEIFQWDFTSTSLNGANFRNCNITNTIFDRASLIGADFSSSYLDMNTFSNVDLSMSNFHTSIIRSSYFHDANLIKANFSNIISDAKSIDRHLRFTYSNLISTTFRDAYLSKVYFRLCNMTYTDLSRTTIWNTLFFGSVLAFTSIVNSTLPLRLSSFPYANLSHADLSGSTCVEKKCEGDTVLSFHNALFHDGRIGRPRSTIISGGNASFCEAYDSITHAQVLLNVWEKQPINDFVLRRERTINNQCVYSMKKNETGKLYQKVRLNGPYKPSFDDLVSNRQAVVIFRAIISEGVEIFIEEKADTQRILLNHTLSRVGAVDNSPLVTSSPILLHSETKELIFRINFYKPGLIRWLHWIDIEINPLFSH
ncbi:unnamed protein product [Adineta ricciae]|uniref:Pentapeptide repeat-containing protein n=1 Tax=Adineta ricciae TaxID=249248 RepID=A0A816BTA3_ADIRI|nr:unnamed protein product [Adineta ricciae]CAF1612473.1 unnamed protein product [Adineta ricciae]